MTIKPKDITRKDFISRSTMATAALTTMGPIALSRKKMGNPIGANDRINVAVIGSGYGNRYPTGSGRSGYRFSSKDNGVDNGWVLGLVVRTVIEIIMKSIAQEVVCYNKSGAFYSCMKAF